VYPKKSNFSSGSLQIRVLVSFTVNLSFVRDVSHLSQCFRSASAADHQIIGVVNDCTLAE
jgi:hypothetical protein